MQPVIDNFAARTLLDISVWTNNNIVIDIPGIDSGTCEYTVELEVIDADGALQYPPDFNVAIEQPTFTCSSTYSCVVDSDPRIVINVDANGPAKSTSGEYTIRFTASNDGGSFGFAYFPVRWDGVPCNAAFNTPNEAQKAHFAEVVLGDAT